MTRNHIEETIGYDFQNDNSLNSNEVYTYSNYLDGSYDCSEEAKENLQEKSNDTYQYLLTNKWCKYFLEELELI